MNAVISSKRIETIREILLASGWTDTNGGYLAPASIREEVAAQYGNRNHPDNCHLHIWDAINAQTRFDSFVCSPEFKAA